MEADLLKEYEMFHLFDNCILQLEEASNAVKAILPGQARKAKLDCPVETVLLTVHSKLWPQW